MRPALPFDDVLSLKDVDLHLAFGPSGLLPTFGEPGVNPVETALRLADRWTRGRHGRRSMATLVYSLTLSLDALEERAEALGVSREITGATLHLLGPSIDPETLHAGLLEWVCAWGLKLLLVDASQADPDEVDALVPLLQDFSAESWVSTVLFLPATEHGDGREEADDGR